MRRYKVQWAYPLEIGNPTIHTNEEAARGEVAYLLGTWIRRALEDYVQRVKTSPVYKRYPELEAGVEYILPEIKRYLSENLVWDAFDLWEEFYVRFENIIGRPLYTMLPTVIVEGSRETGLKNRVPLMDPSENPMEKVKGPIMVIRRFEEKKHQLTQELLEVVAAKADLKGVKISRDAFLNAMVATEMQLHQTGQFQYTDEETEELFLAALREGTLRKLFPKTPGIGLGAMQRWLVQYADFGGTWHPGRHTNEERAKAQAGEYLVTLIHHLSSHAASEARRNPEYAMAAEAITERVHYLLSADHVWTAYLEYKEFEEHWNHQFAPFPLQMAIGTMRVVPEPEPEPVL